MNNKIRLHKKVSTLVKDEGLEYTNPEVQRNIENFGVYVDGLLVKKRLHWVFDEQKIDISHWPKRSSGNFKKVRILEETDDYMVIFKPANVVVQPGAGHQKDNLVTWLTSHYPKQSQMQEDADEQSNAKHTAGLVHRLDKDTQGILLVAKSLDDFDYFQDQFRNRETEKKYLAIVDGVVEKNYHVINWQSRDRHNPIKQKFFWTEKEALDYDEKARNAESVIKPRAICTQTNQTLIEIKIKTGRMHQIRVQCQALGFPLSNDKIYNKKLGKIIDESKDNLEAYLPATPPKVLSKNDFEELKKRIFLDEDYCLLSNYMKIEVKSGDSIEIKYFDLDKYLESQN